ncbi:MAG TPA: hypothetical protein VEG08_01705 [Terriglobales bacterium]|nr:hypothetical protein [Terriglobales bacterium]
MQKPAWKLFLFLTVLMTLVLYTGIVQAQESAATAQPQAAAAPYHPAAAAFATPAPKASSSTMSEGPDPDRKWEIEFHGGGMFSTNPDGGAATLPGPGAPFTDNNGNPSRAVSSFYFGDGALFFNQLITNAFCTGVTCTPITPLDPVLTTRTAERDNGGAFGFRISRDITPRWAIEANFDYSLANLRINSTGLAGIEASRASWATGWNNFFTNVTFGTGIVTTSVATIDRSEGHQIFGTAGVNVNLLTEGRVIPYLSFGGGALANTGDLPSALLVGNYQVTFLGPHNVTDTVLINWDMPGVQGVGYVGGGFKYYVTSRWGIRVDVRDYLSGNGLKQYVSALPVVATLTPAETIAGPPGTTPDVQFSNNPPTGPDTLSGPALTRFRTFSGDGVRNQIVVSGGIFFRF